MFFKRHWLFFQISLPARAQLSHDKGDVTAHISVSHFVIPVPKLTVASSWYTQQSSYTFQTSPTLQASSECIYHSRFARIPHFRHQRSLKSKWIALEHNPKLLTVDLETEAEVKTTRKLRKNETKPKLFLELIVKIPPMELQEPKQFSGSSSQGCYMFDTTLLQILATPTLLLRCVISLVAAKHSVRFMSLHFSLFY